MIVPALAAVVAILAAVSTTIATARPMRRRWYASLLPDRLLVWLHVKLPLGLDPSDGWTAWMDASYLKWCRKDRRRIARGDLYEDEEVFE